MLTNDQRISISNFYPIIAGMLIPPPSFIAKDKILEALIEFCRDSHVWRESLGVGVTTPNWSEIELDLPVNTDFAGWIDIRHRDDSELPDDAYQLSGPRSVQMNAQVAGTGMFNCYASLMPTRQADSVPETLFKRFSYEITAGAAARLAQMPDEDWSSIHHARHYRKIFTDGILEASRFALENYQTDSDPKRLKRDRMNFF